MSLSSPFRLPEYPRQFERFALTASDLLPGSTWERTRDVIQLFHGGQSGISIVINPEALEVRLPSVEWTMGVCEPVEISRLYRRLLLRRLPDPQSPECRELLSETFQATQLKRQSEFKKCRYCKNFFPPEHRASKDICHGCASENLGVVY